MNYRIDVNIVDDHTLLLESLTEAINKNEAVHVSAVYTTLSECARRIAERRPDVLLLDLSMPNENSSEFCTQLLEAYPMVRIIVMTCHDEYSVIKRMMELGVHGYVLKSSPVEELITAIQQVFHGQRFTSSEVEAIITQGEAEQIYLTHTEHDVLQLICQGMSSQQIAEQMCMSFNTAKWYRKRLIAKFEVSNTTTLVAHAVKMHLVDKV